MGAKDAAMALIQVIGVLYPPVATLLSDALAMFEHAPTATAGDIALADQVRSILPESSRSQEVVIDLTNED